MTRTDNPDPTHVPHALGGTSAPESEHAQQRPAKVAHGSRFRTFFDKNPLPMWVYDLETFRVLEVNESATAYYGYARDEFLAMSITEIVLDEDRPRLRDPALRKGEPQRAEVWQHRRRGGETIRVTAVSRHVEVAGRDAVLTVVQDATATKTFEDVPVGLYRASPTGEVLDVNPGFVHMLGYPSRAALLATPAVDIYVDPAVRTHWRARLEREEVVTGFECQLKRYDGTRFWVRTNARAIRDATGRALYYEGAITDITERKQAMAHLEALNHVVTAAASAADLRTFLDTLLDRVLTALDGEQGGVWLGRDIHVGRHHSPEFDAEVVAAAARAGLEPARVEAVEDWTRAAGPMADALAPVMQRHGLRASLVAPLLANGRPIGGFSIEMSHPRRWLPQEIQLVEALGGQIGAVAERLRLLDEVQAHAREMEALHKLGTALRGIGTLDEAYALITECADVLLRGDHSSLVLLDPDGATLRCMSTQGIEITPRGGTFPARASASGVALETGAPYVTRDLAAESAGARFRGLMGPCVAVPMREGERVIGAVVVARTRDTALHGFSPRDVRILTAVADLAGNAIHRTQLSQQLAQELSNLRGLYESAQRMAEILDLERLATDATATCVNAFGMSLAWLATFADNGTPRLVAHAPASATLPALIVPQWATVHDAGPLARALDTGEAMVVPDFEQAPTQPPWRPALLAAGLRTGAVFPLVSRTRTFGILALYGDTPGSFTDDRLAFFRAYTHQLATALENARLYDDAARRFAQLQALREIDLAITASLDLRVTLSVFLDKLVPLLRVDAADVLICDSGGRVVRYGGGHGFRAKTLERVRGHLGQGYADRVAAERRRVAVDLRLEPGEFADVPGFAEEGFHAYHAVPLLAKGQVVGVLEVFHRQALTPDQGWIDFLDALAGQAAIAIDNATLFERLQRANTDLILAYDRTIEGWSRALDLRDEETEGHTQRVAELTLRLAREMGVPDPDLAQIRRGALLHDIGKMGVPDRILLKAGPLTEEEWAVMRRHPVYAYEFLSSIAYLRPALEIPYCHHERWDGTGYPRGLKGEQIPFEARIFAVADVWDALTSNRPYRSAWTPEDSRRYIRAQAGHQFDPQVVEIFLRMTQDP
ncbi:MAG TPA: GAF domain-containing protein [bacterium]|nr:GAF domain-containing protein [bacterium]